MILLLILTAALAANGLSIAVEPDMILYRLHSRLPKWLKKPLGGCVPCTAGSTMGLLVTGLSGEWMWGVIILTASIGMAKVIEGLITKLSIY